MQFFILNAAVFFNVIFLIIAITPFYGQGRCQSVSSSLDKGDHFTVMAYNVENLFDLCTSGKEYSHYIPGNSNWNLEMYRKKLDALVSVISAADPDIVVLSEIENDNAGRALQKNLSKCSQPYPYIVSGDIPNNAVTCQVVLSRYAIVFSQTHPIQSKHSEYCRNILEVDIEFQKQILKIFAVHWRSKHHKESARIEEAQCLMKLIRALAPGTDYIIAGDFNSNFNEAETFYTNGLDDSNHQTGINHVLKTVLSLPNQCIRYVSKNSLRKNPDSLYHYDLWLELPEYKRFSYYFKGRFETLDHILVPATLYDEKGISYRDETFFVFLWDGRLLYNGIPFRWYIQHHGKKKYHRGLGYSDHLPIIATFYLNRDSGSTPDSQLYFPNGISDSLGTVDCAGFESGVEGWIPLVREVQLSRDSTNPLQGIWSLKIHGKTKKNRSVTRFKIPLTPFVYDTNKICLTIGIRGHGRISFRIRIDENKWWYYTDKKFSTVQKSNIYYQYSNHDWDTISLISPEFSQQNNTLVLELRSAKNEIVCVWIDAVRYQ